MKRSKLETYYRDQFGAPEMPEDEPDEPAPTRSQRGRGEPPPRRRGFGVFRLFKLTLMLGPMAILLGATLLMDCQSAPQGSWIPGIVRSTACARRDLGSRVLSLEGNLRMVANSIR